jgi:hypothetical protein
MEDIRQGVKQGGPVVKVLSTKIRAERCEYYLCISFLVRIGKKARRLNKAKLKQ